MNGPEWDHPSVARDQMLERPLPHNADAERAILGSIILDNSLLDSVADHLKREDFYVRAHQFAYGAMLSISERGGEIDPILISATSRILTAPPAP